MNTSPQRRPLPVAAVTIDDEFWSPRQELVRTTTIPFQYEQLMRTGRLEALDLSWRPGDEPTPHIFWESDIAKWIEAASYSLASHPDPQLEGLLDDVIAKLATAQQPDGYLNPYFTVVDPDGRFTDLRDAHELYCAGHLIEAAVAHADATGKHTMLDVMTRYADLLVRQFGSGGEHEGGYPGHEELELALVKLGRATGESRYVELAAKLLDERGTQPHYFELEAQRRGTPGFFGDHPQNNPDDPEAAREYNQSHLPVREQTEAVGHSVRAMYLYSGMADVAAETGDASLRVACETLWQHATTRRMYVTAGLGSSAANEGFTRDHDLPVATGYAETCASIGLVFWANRMARLTGDGRYVDVLEQALFNGILSGMSADGTRFFYDNVLASDGSVERQEWFGVACCPPNLARLLSSLGSYVYSVSPGEAVIDLYVSGSASFPIDETLVEIRQRSRYPRDGAVRIEVDPDVPAEFALRLRIPEWCEEVTLRVNGEAVEVSAVMDRGYAHLERAWQAGDIVHLDLPMPTRRIWAHPDVEAVAGRVALARGPLVYCLEGVDHEVPVHRISLPRRAEVTIATDVLEGVDVLTAEADQDHEEGWAGALYRPAPPERVPTRLIAVPYYSWNNRGQAEMAVWLRDQPD